MIYVPPSGPSPARILACGEAPGGDEEAELKPFVGYSGQELTRMFHEVGIGRSECFITNVCRFHPPNNDLDYFITQKKNWALKRGMQPYKGNWVESFVPSHIEELRAEILKVNPNVIIALGNVALWALTGKRGIMTWRASELECTLVQRPDGSPYKVIPVIHPAAILREWHRRWETVQDLRRVERESKTPALHKSDWTFLVRPSYPDIVDVLDEILDVLTTEKKRLTCDIETRWHRHISCIGIGLSKKVAMCIPLLSPSRKEGYWGPEEELGIMTKLRTVLYHPNTQLINQNILYDLQYLAYWYGIAPPVYMDTMISHHTCFPGFEKALDYQASLYCEHYKYWKHDEKDWSGKVSEEELWSYNCEDCVRTFEVAEVLETVVDKMGLRAQERFQTSLLRPALKIMLRGVAQDAANQKQTSKELAFAIKDREQYFTDILGHPLNPRSTAKNGQMQKLFYDDLRQPIVKNRKTGNPTLDSDALEIIARREPILRPLVKGIEEYRSLNIFKDNFVDAKTGPDNRMRCSYNLAGAETFRWSSSMDAFGMGCNLQTIPMGQSGEVASYCKVNGPTAAGTLAEILKKPIDKLWLEIDKEEKDGAITVSGNGDSAIIFYRLLLPNVRRQFIPDPGMVLMDWDLERADLYVVVWEADDKELKQMLREGVDMHVENAKLLGIARQIAKNWVHATNYVCSPRTAARNFGITVQKAEWMQRRWFAAHPGILNWHKRVERSLATTRRVYSRFGYCRFYADRLESILPEAVAWGPQHTVAIVINTGLLNIDTNIPQDEVQPLLQVHDSLVLQSPKSIFPAPIVSVIRKHLEVTVPYEDPLVIPVNCKWSETDWGSVEELRQ
jgi:DNA polymerase